MKWINHKIITFSLVYGWTGDVLGSAIAGVASIGPDWIEGKDFQSESWRKRHRTFSHWFLFWACLWFVFFLLSKDFVGKFTISELFTGLSEARVIYYVFFFILTGWVLHIIEDAISGGVPIINPFKKIYSFRLFRTGSFWEYFLSILAAIFVLIKLS
ncbi:MAG: metal-dependent hydrolase [Desulfurococcaceae archaeon]